MQVVQWQIAVLLTVAAARMASRNLGILVAVCWTVWSLTQIRLGPLMAVQLGFAWGTLWVTDAYQARRREVEHRDATIRAREAELQDRDATIGVLRLALTSLPAASRARIQALPESDLGFLEGEQHRRALLKAIRMADSGLVILSGWISAAVVDEEVLGALWEALTRGVHIDLGYGFRGFDGESSRSQAAQRALVNLERLNRDAAAHGLHGRLSLHEFPNHEKLILVDSKLLICGSHNWLSNSRFDNSERSVVVKEPHVIEAETRRVRALLANPER